MRKSDLNGFKLKPFPLLVFFGLLFYSLAVHTQTKSDTKYNPLPPTSWEGNLEEISPKVPLQNEQQNIGVQRKVHMIYLVPTNKIYSDSYKTGITYAILHLRDFYREQLGSNYEFTLNDPIVEVYFTSHDTAWYQNNPNTSVSSRFWNNVVNDGKALTGATDNSTDKWLFYIDADPLCGQLGGAAQVNGPFGVLPANDLRGLTGQQNIPTCSNEPADNGGRFRWIGGLGHELGHTFGLPHPPGCGGSGPNYGCTGGQTAATSLMWVGYALYPNTHLLPSDKITCINSGFFTHPGIASKPFDFDGDGKTDYAVAGFARGGSTQQYRFWYILINGTNEFRSVQWGLLGDLEVPADYDGDGKTDIAVLRGGNWYLLKSRDGFTGVQFGQGGDIPMPADYDGDEKADIAVFRPSNGTWYLLRSSQGFAGVQFGQNGDKPVASDYDGDGKADIAVYRDGSWYLLQSNLGFAAVGFGIASDKTVPADYDGDGKADIAVYRGGVWYLLCSQLGFLGVSFGLPEDKPVVGDYDGDGRADIAVWRPSDSVFHVLRSQDGSYNGIQFGQIGDMPIAFAFVR
jgi:FG-GAP-like repeat